MKSLTLQGTKRTDVGKKDANRLRREGNVVCNLYGGTDSLSFYAPYLAFQHIVYSPDFFTVNVEVGGKSVNTIIKEIQFHPVSDRIVHIDFLELVPGKKIFAEIPVELVGQAEGVKAGGKLVQKVRKVKVKVDPEHLVDKITVNVESLKLGKSIKIKEIEAGELEILTSGNIPLATVDIPRALKSAETEAAKAPKAAAPKAAAPAAKK